MSHTLLIDAYRDRCRELREDNARLMRLITTAVEHLSAAGCLTIADRPDRVLLHFVAAYTTNAERDFTHANDRNRELMSLLRELDVCKAFPSAIEACDAIDLDAWNQRRVAALAGSVSP